MNNQIICKICNNIKNSPTTFMVHFNKNHLHEISIEKYSIDFKIHEDYLCVICKNQARFISFSKGFKPTCENKECQNKYKYQRTVEALVKKYGVINPGQLSNHQEKCKATKLDRYGDENYTNLEKQKQTNLDRYGCESFLGTKECVELQRQASLKKYGVEHHSQSDEFKEKMKEYFFDKYGVEYSLQIPEVREKIKNTFEELYGGFTFASPILSQKVKETMIDLYGVEFAQQNLEIKKQTKQTNLDKYGVEFPAHNKESLLERYGVERVCEIPDLIEKQKKNRKENLLKKYGVENVSQLESTQETIRNNNLEKYGVEYPMQLQEIQQKMKETNLDRYGFENAMQNPEIAKKCFENTIKSFKHKKYKTKFGDNVIYQSKPELNFIKKCEEDNIRILRGDIIEYLFEDEIHHYCIDFKIFIDNKWQLVEIKGPHPWYYEDLENGKLRAKIKAAEQYSKDNNFHPYKFILVE